MIKEKKKSGSVAIDTVPLPERNARLAAKMLKVERQLGRIVAAAKSSDDLTSTVLPMRKCSFRPRYRYGMSASEGSQATCDAIEAFLDCLAGK
jgi:hypothetical protein